MLDNLATEYARYQQEQKEEKVRQHKREKRKAKKIAAVSVEKGTEQERQGMLEANGKDNRKGGTSYKKLQDVEATSDAQAGAKNEDQRLEKDSRIAEIRKPGWFFSGEDVLRGE